VVEARVEILQNAVLLLWILKDKERSPVKAERLLTEVVEAAVITEAAPAAVAEKIINRILSFIILNCKKGQAKFRPVLFCY
jgi:hypothetical protein